MSVNGLILYKGPSKLDGTPVVAIATGLKGKSQNTKTGNMIQTWIMLQNDTPVNGVKSGKDVSICGDCKHRLWKTCYVNVSQGPQAVYHAWLNGKYATMTPGDLSLFSNRIIRIGSYGDPSAVPTNIWRQLCGVAKGYTGYTHQWRNCDPKLKLYCMASVDTVDEYDEAVEAGWRTFRVKSSKDKLLQHEIACPASEEGGHKTQCERCLCCNGCNNKPTVAINVHGLNFKKSRFEDKTNVLCVSTVQP